MLRVGDQKASNAALCCICGKLPYVSACQKTRKIRIFNCATEGAMPEQGDSHHGQQAALMMADQDRFCGGTTFPG